MKRWRFLSIAITVLALVLIILPSQIASAEEICGLWDTVSVMGGEYTIMNNVWGATTAQCIDVPSTNSNAFSVTRADHNQGSVAAYPAVFKGCHWGDCTNNSGMPILVSQVNNAPFSWNVTSISSGTWNIAAEAWFSPIADSSDGYNGGAELMIWLDYQGMQPSGSQVGTVSIGGATWEVWYSNIGWNYIAYRRIGSVSSINADLKTFINDAVSRGYIQNSWYLHAFEAGTELMTGGTGFASNSFTFNVNGGTPPTSTPVTVVPPTSTPVTVIPPTSTPVTVIPPTSTPSPGGVYQAEDASLGGGVSVDTNHSGYYGTGFVNFPSSSGYVEYQNVDGGTGGSRTLRFRSALGASSSRTGQLTVNGASQNITFSPTGSWDSWAILEVSANLNAGANNTIRLQSTGQDLANQDQMEVVGGTTPPTATPVTVVPPTSTPVTVVPPTATPVTVVPPTATPPTTTPGACSVNYAIQNDWGSGATVNVTIQNNGTSAINGWTLCWTFPGNQQIVNLWNGSYTQSGVSVCVSDAGWNAFIGANGGTTNFGFNLIYSGSNNEPTDFTLNGTPCQ